MRKNILLISSWLLTLIFGILFFYNIGDEKELVENTIKKEVNNNNFLTMMLETSSGSGEYALSNSGEWPGEGYIFNSELSKCENGGELSWDSEQNRVLMQSNKSDRCYVYFDKEPDIVYLTDYIISQYTTDGANGLYYHDGSGSYTNASQEAGDNSYRYAGADPNNYVCFGSDAATCPNDNLYRIIGVFGDEVKLIKYDYATSTLLGTGGAYYNTLAGSGNGTSYYKGSTSTSSIGIYYWTSSSNSSNVWSGSLLNTTNLNTNYISNIGSAWSNLIAEYTWQVGGATDANVYNSPVKTAHTYEVGASTANTTYTAKIGLMYTSDYGYAASPENWSTNMGSLNNDTNRNNNWMYMGLSEWTISRRSDATNFAFYVLDNGFMSYSYVRYRYGGVRPSFYLESSVTYNGGTGSASDPYRIS